MKLIHGVYLIACTFIYGCASSVVAPQVPTSRGAQSHVTPISIKETFESANKLNDLRGQEITVLPGRTPVLEIDNNNLAVVPIILNEPKPKTIKIKSRIVQLSDGSYLLFYPVLSLVTDDFNIYRTIKPKYEFNFQIEQKLLTNEFEIPADTNKIIVRTDKEFLQSDFKGQISYGSRPLRATRPLLTPNATLTLLILKAIEPNEPSGEFRLGEVGIISIEYN